MKITELGRWVRYTPDPWPKDLPPNIAFCRRESDGKDWYEFQKAMSAETVKMTVMTMGGGDDALYVQAVTRDASRLFPAYTLLLQVEGLGEADPDLQITYGRREYLGESKGFGAMAAVPLPPISDRQFFQALAMNGLITPEEALGAVKTGDIPAPMAAVVDTIEDPQQQFAARMLLSGATTFERKHPLVNAFAASFGMTGPQVDDLWRLAATL